jgi:hypothetical protein
VHNPSAFPDVLSLLSELHQQQGNELCQLIIGEYLFLASITPAIQVIVKILGMIETQSTGLALSFTKKTSSIFYEKLQQI